MFVVQADLDLVRRQWNTHRIRPSAGAICPAGVPDELYFLPQHSATDCLQVPTVPLPLELYSQLEQPRACEDDVFGAYLHYLCTFKNWQLPHDSESATVLYFKLLPFLS